MKVRKISLLGTFILCLTGIAISNLALAACPVFPNEDFGSKLILSIRDCTGVLPEDNCARSVPPEVWYEEACLGKDQNERVTISGLGSADGSVRYDGPASLPTMRQTSFTTADSRNGSTMESWQVYTYDGTDPIILPIVADLTYEYSGESGSGIGLNQVAIIVNVIVWDASLINVADFPDHYTQGYRYINASCGDEAFFGLAEGAIIAQAAYHSDSDGSTTPWTLDLSKRCDDKTDVIVNPGDSFIVATVGQAIADRGGWVDMGHTLAVKFAEDTPPEVLMALVDNIEPTCDDCGREQLNAQIKTGGNSCLETSEDGMIFVNIIGSDTMDVSKVRIDESLILGSLDIPFNTQLQKCKEGNINKDDFVDLNCKFKHGVLEANNEEIEVLLRGKMIDGTPIEGVDTVCLSL